MTIKTKNLAWKRANALVWDHLIVALLSVFILSPTIFTLTEEIKTPEELIKLLMSSIYTIPALILIFVFMIFYEPVCTYKYGWTLGKKMCGLRVVDDQGNRLSLPISLLRFMLKSLCLSLPYANFILIIMCYIRQTKGKKMLWDEWVGTNVVTSSV